MNPVEENKSFKSSSLTEELRDKDARQGLVRTRPRSGTRTAQLQDLEPALRDVGEVQRGRRREDVVEVFRSGFFEAVEGGA